MKKSFLLVLLVLFTMTGVEVQAQANIYASGLSAAAPGATSVAISYFLNTDATAVAVNFVNATTGTVVATVPVTEAALLTKGAHTATVPYGTNVPSGTWRFSVTATAPANAGTDPVKITDDSQRFLFWGPRGVAVDNSFESPFFGRVYTSEGSGGTVTAGAPNPTRTTTKGVYIFNAALEDVTNQGATAYGGGITWGGLYRLAVAPDGKVYLTDNSIANSGVWVMDPANPATNFTPVFGGTLDANGLAIDNGVTIHGRIPHCWVVGTGAETQLFTYDAGANNTGNINRYDIGNLSAPWTSAPSEIVYDDAANGNLQQGFNSCIIPDGHGGWWISQYRAGNVATVSSIPCLIHYNGTTVDFNSGEIELANTYQGGVAISGNLLALGTTSGVITVYEVAYNGVTGVPTLTEKYSIAVATGAYAIGMAFDQAQNLYAIDNNQERLRVWALPKAENTFTTPAPQAATITVNNPLFPNSLATIVPDAVRFITEGDHINIVSTSGDRIQTVTVFDAQGRLITAYKGLSVNSFPVTLPAKGVYVIDVVTEKTHIAKKAIN